MQVSNDVENLITNPYLSMAVEEVEEHLMIRLDMKVLNKEAAEEAEEGTQYLVMAAEVAEEIQGPEMAEAVEEKYSVMVEELAEENQCLLVMAEELAEENRCLLVMAEVLAEENKCLLVMAEVEECQRDH